MKYKKLGQSEVKVSVISMGCWAISGDSTWGPQKESDANAAIHAALDAGINFFDTAEVYGNGYSEKIVGQTLSKRRKEVIIASKVSPDYLRPNNLRESCENSLRRLKTDYIDLYYIHWPNWRIPIEDTLSELEKLKEEGKIRLVGCSNFGKIDLTELLKKARVEVNQLPYNLIWRAIEYEIQPISLKNDIAITCYSPLAQGLLTGKFDSADEVPEGRARTRHFSGNRPQARHEEVGAEKETFETLAKIREICQEINAPMAQVALSWLLSQPGIVSIIVGARNPQQINVNVKAAELKLPPEILEQLTLASEDLKGKLGSNPDMWSSDSRIR
jgi:aryl-alcohol dehydrogenase-like predicted oxidoreductase